MQSRSAWAGLVVVLMFFLAYGYGLGVLVDGPYNDPCQGSPGMAAMAVMVSGIAAGLVIIPVVSVVYAWLVPKPLGKYREESCFLATILGLPTAVVGFLLFGALPLFHWVPSC